MPAPKPAVQLKALDALIAGKSITETCGIASINVRHMVRLARDWGHPDPACLAAARSRVLVDVNEERRRNGLLPLNGPTRKPRTMTAPAEPTPQLVTDHEPAHEPVNEPAYTDPEPEVLVTDPDPEEPNPAEQPDEVPTPEPTAPELTIDGAVAELLDAGDNASRQQTRTLAARARQNLRELHQLLNAERAENRQAVIAEARAAADRMFAISVVRGLIPAERLRAWGLSAGHKVSTRGRIPDTVCLAYAEDHPELLAEAA
ncbi:hypothetical protein GCM10027418_06380 [Mariniluteicoccus endophyticus]